MNIELTLTNAVIAGVLYPTITAWAEQAAATLHFTESDCGLPLDAPRTLDIGIGGVCQTVGIWDATPDNAGAGVLLSMRDNAAESDAPGLRGEIYAKDSTEELWASTQAGELHFMAGMTELGVTHQPGRVILDESGY